MKQTAWVISVALILCLVGCAPKTENKAVTSKDVVEQAQKTLDTLQKYLQEQKEVHLKSAEARLALLDQRIEILQTRAVQQSEEAKAKFEKQVAAFQDKEKAAREKLDKMVAATDENWEKMVGGIVTAMNDLEREFNKVLEKI